MLSLFVTVIKIIGIVLAAILGLFILVVAAFLWVPFHYQIKASKYEEITADVKIYWLFRLISININYIHEKLEYVVRVLGFHIIDSKRPKKKKKTAKNRKSKKVKKVKQKNRSKENEFKVSHKKKSKRQSSESDKSQVLVGGENDADKVLSTKQDIDQVEIIKITEEISNDQEYRKQDEIARFKSDTIDDENQSAKKTELESDEFGINSSGGMKSRFEKILNTIRLYIRKLKNFIRKVVHFFTSLPEKINQWKQKFKKGMKYPKKIKEFLMEEENKTAIGVIFQMIKQLIKHAKPRRIRGNVTFGFDDPATTGQVLGGVSVAYAYLNLKRVNIIPDFEQAKLEGYVDAKGRIYSFVVLKLVIKLLKDKNFKSFRNRIKQFKEE